VPGILDYICSADDANERWQERASSPPLRSVLDAVSLNGTMVVHRLWRKQFCRILESAAHADLLAILG
jgi:hypothetical protein